MTKGKRIGIAAVIIAIVLLLISTQVTIFVVPPIGAVPEGRTLVISRLTNTKFIDSADAMCERINDGVSLFCRGIILGRVAEASDIYLRLPYSKTLNSIANEGREYDR